MRGCLQLDIASQQSSWADLAGTARGRPYQRCRLCCAAIA